MELPGKILVISNDHSFVTTLRTHIMPRGFNVMAAETTEDGVELLTGSMPHLVVCDAQLDDMNLDRVMQVMRELAPGLPLIVVLAEGDRVAVSEILNAGAVDVLMRPVEEKDFKFLIGKIEYYFARLQAQWHSSFVLSDHRVLHISNDITIIPAVVNYIFCHQCYIARNDALLRLGLQEILINAIEHGNLGIAFDEKARLLDSGEYLRELKFRARQPRYRHREVRIFLHSEPTFLKIVIDDMGEGFDITQLPDPAAPDNFLKESGRGILIAMNAFDHVLYNEKGNRVTLIKFSEYNTCTDRQAVLLGKDDAVPDQVSRDFDVEMNLALEFQRTFLPKKENLRKFTGLKSDYYFEPRHRVSGDFIDFTKLDENVFGFFISDISGHGVAAALISAMLKVFFSLYARDVLSPQLLFEILNSEFYDYLNSGEYFTSFYGIYFQEERRFIYTNANHPPPLLLKAAAGETIPLNSEGFFVGIFKEAVFEEKEYFLEPGDRLLFYTDGIVEAVNERHEQFGMERLTRFFLEKREYPLAAVIPALIHEVREFAKDGFNDDVTLGIVEIE